MIYITGDVHGMIDDPERFEIWNFPEGADLTRDDYVIIVGDFGMPFDLMESDIDLRALAAKPWTTLFIDGNHEHHAYLNELPETEWHGGMVHRYPRYKNIIHLMRGEIYDIDGHSFFCMGGAQSLDKEMQASMGTWFPEEMPDDFEYANALDKLDRADWRVDFVLTHTCANRFLEEAIGSNAFPGVGVITDDLTSFFDELEDKLEYDHWFFGHFHNDTELDSGHTCLYRSIVDLDDYL